MMPDRNDVDFNEVFEDADDETAQLRDDLDEAIAVRDRLESRLSDIAELCAQRLKLGLPDWVRREFERIRLIAEP